MSATDWDSMGPRETSEKALKAAREALLKGHEHRRDDEPDPLVAHMKRHIEAHQVMIHPRPSSGWVGLMCRGLGDLPDVPRPTLEEYPDVRRYRVLPYLTLLLPIGIILALAVVLPGAILSPVTATGRALGGDEGQLLVGQIITLLLATLVVGFLAVVGAKRVKSFLFDAALDEELWFRFNSETWTAGRRVRACIQFGFAHLINLVVAVATLGALALVGGVYMWVYLREVRETGDPRRAALVSAQFHATYNWGAVMVLFFGATFVLVTMFLPLVL